MFTWHDATRRRLCRLAFLALVAVPTCAVFLAAAWIRTPLARAHHRRALAEQLALDVTLNSVSFPRPELTRYDGLTIRDPESGDWLAQFSRLEIDESGPRTRIVCSEPELNATRLDLFWELASRRLRRQASIERPVEIAAPTLRLYFGSDVQSLVDVHTRFKQGEAGPQGLVVFHLDDQDSAAEVRMALLRSSAGRGGAASPGSAPSGGGPTASAAATIVQLETGQAVLPGRLLAALLPGWEALGGSATLAGSLWWQEGPEGFSGQIRGRIDGIDLDALVSEPFDRKLGGTATLELEWARIRDGRLIDAKGRLAAGPGLVSRKLLADAASWLHAPAGALSDSPGTLVTYEQLGFAFAVDERGLTLQGACLSAPTGTLLLGRSGRPLLNEPPPAPQSPLNLVRALAGPGEERLPTTTAAQTLMRLLPQAARQGESGQLGARPTRSR